MSSSSRLHDGTGALFAAAGLAPPAPTGSRDADALDPRPGSRGGAGSDEGRRTTDEGDSSFVGRPSSAGQGDLAGWPGRRGAPERSAATGSLPPDLDVWRLAGMLVPGLGRGQRARLAEALKVPLPASEPVDPAAQRREADAIARACIDHLASLDVSTLQRLNTIFAGSRLPEAAAVRLAVRARVRSGFGPAPGNAGADAGLEAEVVAAFSPPPALQPSRYRRPVDQVEALRALSPGGAVSRVLPGFESRPGQQKMVRAVAKALSEQLHLIAEAGTGTGKALDVNTPIPTPDGWKRMGDLVVGDMVFDEAGRRTRVTAAFDVMLDRPCFEVEFSDGSRLVADAEHEWVTYTSRDRKWEDRPRGSVYRSKNFATRASLAALRANVGTVGEREFKSLPEAAQFLGGPIWTVSLAAAGLAADRNGNRPRRVPARPLLTAVLHRLERDVIEQRRDQPPFTLVTTQQLAATLRVGATGRLNHAVPVARALDLPQSPLPIDPYFLGAWLGDGDSRNSQITSADPQVAAEIQRSGYTVRRLPSHPYRYAVDDQHGKGKDRWQPGLTGALRRLGLLQNKHIPVAFLRSSEQQRRDLLAGLLDTDGGVSRTGAVEFTTVNPRLAKDVAELVSTLGYRAAIRESRARLNGRDCGPTWMVQFTTPDDVFRLDRKRQMHAERRRTTSTTSTERTRFRYVVAVRPVPSRPVRCIQVDSPSHLYLAGTSFIPTHNSLAYLVPAVMYAVANGRRVVVSTNTINLQEQLYSKDLPLVRQALPLDFRASVLKGRANYLCLRRWRAFLRDGVTSEADRILAAKVLLWLRQTETGDRGELALDDYEAARWVAALAADALHCTPPLCRDNRIGRCFLSRARRRAESAHILVVNHALLLADQALENKVLPEYADLVLDEAHHLEDVATDQLGVTIDQQELTFFLASISQPQGPGRYAGIVARLQTVLITAGGAPMRAQAGEVTQPAHDATEEARRLLHEFFAAVAGFARSAGGGLWAGERDIRLTPALRRSQEWEDVEAAWQPFGAALGRLEQGLARIAEALDPYQGQSDLVDDALADLAGITRQIADVRIDLGAIVAQASTDQVCWVAVRDRSLSLRAAPLEVGPLLQQNLFSQKDTVILTSATLQVGGSFRHIRHRLGLDDHAFSLEVPSPFDYASQALLCVPHDLPDPSTRAFGDASLDALAAICDATRGRTLVLFTSHAALRAAHEHLQRRARGLVILGQGLDGARGQLLDRFRTTSNCILLGTSSFWEGIDVVGDALSCLVIVKLPFSVPSDPVFAARSELFENPFFEYAVPQAVLRLKQGFGRLIRSGTDRGVVVILDSRVLTKRYGSVFLRSLPPATQRRCGAAELGTAIRSWLAAQPPARAQRR